MVPPQFLKIPSLPPVPLYTVLWHNVFVARPGALIGLNDGNLVWCVLSSLITVFFRSIIGAITFFSFKVQ